MNRQIMEAENCRFLIIFSHRYRCINIEYAHLTCLFAGEHTLSCQRTLFEQFPCIRYFPLRENEFGTLIAFCMYEIGELWMVDG